MITAKQLDPTIFPFDKFTIDKVTKTLVLDPQWKFQSQAQTAPNTLAIAGRSMSLDSAVSSLGMFWFDVPTPDPFDSSHRVYDMGYNPSTGTIMACGAWIPGLFSVLGRSTDGGKTFSAVTSVATYSIFGIATDGVSTWVCIGGFSAGPTEMSYSTDDGVTWTAIPLLFGGGTPATGIQYANGYWLASGRSGAGIDGIARSTDGINWTMIYTTPDYELGVPRYGNGVWFVNTTTGVLLKSEDNGTTWSVVDLLGTSDQVYVPAFSGSSWTVGIGTGIILRSTDRGVTWTSIANPFAGLEVTRIVYTAGMYIAVAGWGTTGVIARSLDDGLTWGAAYGDDVFISAYDGGVIYALCGVDSHQRILLGGTGSIPLRYSDYVEAGAGIVERGENSNGSWVKFADGSAKQFVWGFIQGDGVNGVVGDTLAYPFQPKSLISVQISRLGERDDDDPTGLFDTVLNPLDRYMLAWTFYNHTTDFSNYLVALDMFSGYVTQSNRRYVWAATVECTWK